MKLKLIDLKVKSFVTNKMTRVRGGSLPTEDVNCTDPASCGQPTGLFCPTNNCPSEWGTCGPTGLC